MGVILQAKNNLIVRKFIPRYRQIKAINLSAKRGLLPLFGLLTVQQKIQKLYKICH